MLRNSYGYKQASNCLDICFFCLSHQISNKKKSKPKIFSFVATLNCSWHSGYQRLGQISFFFLLAIIGGADQFFFLFIQLNFVNSGDSWMVPNFNFRMFEWLITLILSWGLGVQSFLKICISCFYLKCIPVLYKDTFNIWSPVTKSM